MQVANRSRATELAIRRMRRPDLDIVCSWAAIEHWNPGLHDGDAFFAADPGGYFLGEIERSPVAYSEDFGFLGQYIVRPELRGKGLGVQVWKAGMKYLGGRNVGLDGVLDQQANYEKSGFQFTHHHIRLHATGCGEATRRIPRTRHPETGHQRRRRPLAWRQTLGRKRTRRGIR